MCGIDWVFIGQRGTRWSTSGLEGMCGAENVGDGLRYGVFAAEIIGAILKEYERGTERVGVVI